MQKVIALLLVAMCALGGTAHAEDKKLAEQFFRLGEKAYQQQNFAAAAENFEDAYRNFNLPEIAFSAAQAYRRLYRIDPKPEHVARAVEHYQFYLRERKSGGARIADAIDALAEMQRELDKLLASGVKVSPELAKEYTKIVINPSLGKESTPTNLEEVKEGTSRDVAITATLDGKPVAVYAPINVVPKLYKIVVTAEGYFTAEKMWNVRQGQTAIADIPLVPKPALVTIEAEDGARVSVDGRPAGDVPLPPQELSAGRHVITLSMRGRVPIARELVVTRGQQLTLRERMRPTRRRELVPYFLGGAAFATAVFGVSATFALIRDNDGEDQLYDLQLRGGWTAADKAQYDRTRLARDRWAIASFVSGGLLVALGATAAVLYYTDNPSPDGVRVEPLPIAGGGGAAIAGGF